LDESLRVKRNRKAFSWVAEGIGAYKDIIFMKGHVLMGMTVKPRDHGGGEIIFQMIHIGTAALRMMKRGAIAFGEGSVMGQ
jgi:hypothetical protein